MSSRKKQENPRYRHYKRQNTKYGRVKRLQIDNTKIARMHLQQPGPLNIEVNQSPIKCSRKSDHDDRGDRNRHNQAMNLARQAMKSHLSYCR